MFGGLQVASLYGVLSLTDQLTPGLAKAKGSLSSFARDMGSQLTSMGAALTAGLTVPIVGFLGASVKAASDYQTSLTQLDAALRSTSSGNGTFSDATAGTAKEITKLTKEVATATTHVDALQQKWNTSTKHTQAQANALVAAKNKLSDLQGQLSSATAVTQTSNTVLHLNRQAYIDLAKSMADTTRFSKDQVLSTEDLLLTFTNIGKNIFPDATKAVLDMSQALGQDTKSSAIQLGKALQDPIKGVTALQRVGVMFTQQQKDQIKALVDSGKTMEAQKLILREIQKEFGGSAVAAGDTFAGKLDILNHHFTDLQEKIGFMLMPVLEKFMNFIGGLVDKLEALNPNILQMGVVALIAVAAIGPVLGILGAIATVIAFVLSPIGLLVAAIAGLGAIIALALTGQLPKFLESLGTFVSGLVAKIGEFVGKNAPKVVKAFEDLLGKVGDWLSSGGLGKLVIGLGDMMGNAARWFITDGAPMILKGIEGLFNAIKTFLDSPGWIKFRDGLLNVIKQAGDWVINTGWPLFKKSIDALVQLIVTALKPITQAIIDAVTKGIYDAYNAVAALTGQPQVHIMPPGWKPPTSGGIGGGNGINIGMQGFKAGGPVGAGGGFTHPGEFVVPEGGVLVSKGGGSPSTVHIVFQADDFVKHLYVNIADAIHEGVRG